jgi:hypothetical protein
MADWPDDPDAFLIAYMDAWNRSDLDRICDAYHTPSLIYKRGEVQANLGEIAKRAYFGALLDGTRSALAAGACWERPEFALTPLGRDSNIATVRWVFRAADGTILQDYLDSYHLVRLGGHWQFLGDTVHTELDDRSLSVG